MGRYAQRRVSGSAEQYRHRLSVVPEFSVFERGELREPLGEAGSLRRMAWDERVHG
jgi:hypothetical protein